MGAPELIKVFEPAEPGPAIVFVHGFGGDAAKTWGQFPAFLRDTPSLGGWGIYSLGYSSKLMPDLRGMWAGDPGIETLGTYLHTRATQAPLKDRRLALIAHSMGGLVVQKALVDFPDLTDRISHVLFYGTPSAGLAKASGFLGRLFKRQSEDMGLDSDFIPSLREAWRQKFGDADRGPQGRARPFGLWSVAGDRDEFVPATSSMGPFAKKERVVVPGNHLEIVKPAAADSMSVRAAVNAIVGNAAPGGPWNAARVAVEMGEFQEAIARLEPNVADLDEPSAVLLALALEAVGRRDDAIEALEQRRKRGGTDAMGTLAGRFKRVWWSLGTETPAGKALELYQQAYDLSVRADDPAQAFYNGINVAFMQFAFKRDAAAAAAMANQVLEHCKGVPDSDVWCLATIGEANFYLNQPDQALAAYQRVVATHPQPWQMRSIFTQAMHVAEALDNEGAQRKLREIFRQENDI